MTCFTVLKRKGFKLTPQRRAVIEVLESAHGHLTADGIISFIQPRVPGINRSTVYRILDLLEEQGCVFRSEIEGRFIYHHAGEGHHHHLVCSKCGRILDCGEDVFLSVQEALEVKYGFQADFKHMIIRGLCRECR